MTRVLFIVKCRGTTYQQTEDTVPIIGEKNYCMSSGLLNSATFVSQMLNAHNITSKVVQVVDNNQIDREVARFRPTHVMIEALWVVPEKFKVLRKLHPKVKWIIRLHSEIPFISNEGNAIDWTLACMKQHNVFIAPNTERMYYNIKTLADASFGPYVSKEKILLLPNYYFSKFEKWDKNPNVIHISCFGAIRPLKNQLEQALAAIQYAKGINKKLYFHINSGRVEHGNNALKNIRALFSELDTTKYELVEHGWLSHENFLDVIRSMDLCLQVSFSETFNITTADAVSQGIPVVVSDEINWVSSLFHAKATSTDDIVKKMKRALRWKSLGTWLNHLGLRKYNKCSTITWLNYLRD